jgi:hypothetical protein
MGVLEYSRGLRAPSEHAVLLREVAAPYARVIGAVARTIRTVAGVIRTILGIIGTLTRIIGTIIIGTLARMIGAANRLRASGAAGSPVLSIPYLLLRCSTSSTRTTTGTSTRKTSQRSSATARYGPLMGPLVCAWSTS